MLWRKNRSMIIVVIISTGYHKSVAVLEAGLTFNNFKTISFVIPKNTRSIFLAIKRNVYAIMDQYFITFNY